MTGTVSPAGRDLLLVARALVLGGPYEAVESVLREGRPMPGVGADAMRLFEEALALGCVRALARLGGWRRQARIAGRGVETGRLWDVHRESPLAFSTYAFELCRWLVAEPLGGARVAAFESTPRRAGDELVAYLACAFVEEQPLERRLAQQPGIQASALAWLGFPAMLGRAAGGADGAGWDPVRHRFEALAHEGAVVLEAVSDDLARRAAAFERAKASITSPMDLRRLGGARDRTLGFLLDALDAAGRWDLASFLVTATVQLGFAETEAPLDPSASLRDRAEARRASAAHGRHLGRLGRHHEGLRQVRHFDEGYLGAQLLLTRWEALGSHGFSLVAERVAASLALDGG